MKVASNRKRRGLAGRIMLSLLCTWGAVASAQVSIEQNLTVGGQAEIQGPVAIAAGGLHVDWGGTAVCDSPDSWGWCWSLTANGLFVGTVRAGLLHGDSIQSGTWVSAQGISLTLAGTDCDGRGGCTRSLTAGDGLLENLSVSEDLFVARTASTEILEIRGGADIAEPFRISGTGVEPGMVVSIDPLVPGALKVADKRYDRAVAGIVSGANGLEPGLLLRSPALETSGVRLALAGRVWCYADAGLGGPIVPGDLLTSSSTPGHAMRVGDHTKAVGAILGKAMTGLPSGRGRVLVLVGLQ